MQFRSGIICFFILTAELLIGQPSDSLMLERFKKNLLNIETPDSIIKSVWDLNNQSWTNEWRGNYLYDDNGFKKNEFVSNWKDNKWQPDYNVDYYYYQNNLNEEIVYSWDDYYEMWIPKSRYLFTYNNLNLIVEKLDLNWYHLQNKWINDTTIIYQYNSTNELTGKYVNVWSSYINDWENNSWTDFTYHLGNKNKQTFSIWDFYYLIWDIRSITKFVYDTENRIIEQCLLTKRSLSANWLNDSKIEYKYNINSLIEEEIYWYWDEVQQNWFENYKIAYVYDNNSKLINLTLFYFDWDYLIWTNRYQTVYNYDNDSQLIRSTFFYWNYGQWINQYLYNYYYPGYTTVNKVETSFTMKLFPNPASESIQIELSKPWLGDIQIKITDLGGKLVYNQQHHNHQSIHIRLPKLTNGVYLVHVILENKVYTEKIVIRN